MVWKRLLLDFIIGGGLVAVALLLGKIAGPFVAGIVAALPLRLGATLLLSGISSSPEFVMEMLRGSIPTTIGNVALIAILAKRTSEYGILKASLLASSVCVVIIVLGVMLL